MASYAENVSILWRHHDAMCRTWCLILHVYTCCFWLPSFTHGYLDMQSVKQYAMLYICCSWWRHEMGTFSALLAICAGNSPVPVNSPHKGQWRGALMFSLICVWINGWVNNRETGNLRRHQAHCNVLVMSCDAKGQTLCTSGYLSKLDVKH